MSLIPSQPPSGATAWDRLVESLSPFKGSPLLDNALYQLNRLSALISKANIAIFPQLTEIMKKIGNLSKTGINLVVPVDNIQFLINALPDEQVGKIVAIAGSLAIISGATQINLVKDWRGIRLHSNEIQALRAMERRFHIRFNDITSLPIGDYQYSFTHEFEHIRSIIITNLDSCTVIPPEIGKLTRLEFLHMECCNIRSISPEIGKLKQLRNLSLRGNHIAFLPPALGNLSRLQQLNLSDNELKTIPNAIGNLKKLENLLISHNRIYKLGHWCRQLASLRYLDIGSNNLANLPESFTFSPSIEEISCDPPILWKLASTIDKLPKITKITVYTVEEGDNHVFGFDINYPLSISREELLDFPKMWELISAKFIIEEIKKTRFIKISGLSFTRDSYTTLTPLKTSARRFKMNRWPDSANS